MAKKASQGEDPSTSKREQPLQAVLLADSFTNNFRPISLDRPKMLCPLNNVAMIDYAMDFLVGAGVEELFVVCVSDMVESYIQNHSWNSSSMQVSVIKDSFISNAGDALRELDKRNLVQSDPFILMFGDVVTNVDLVGALASHKERHKKDSSAMMTILMKDVGSTELDGSKLSKHSRIRANTEDLVVAIDPSHENRILLYDDRSAKDSVSIPCSFFASHPEVELRCNVLDCGIDICSPDVLARFSDEFDYGDIRSQFVANSVAEEEEGLQNKIYAHFLRSDEYAARVHDFSTYAAVSQDLLRRWCYPVVPDNLPSGYDRHYRYTLQRHYMYHERKSGKSRIGRSTKVQGPGMIGSHCIIGEKCLIEGTVIGSNCHIASNVRLRGAHIWDSVEIGEGAVVEHAILADGAVILPGAVVSRGCVVGSGCIVGANVKLPEFTRITLKEESDDNLDDDWGDSDESDEEDEDDDSENPAADASPADSVPKDVVGADGKGHVWNPTSDEDDHWEEVCGLSAEEALRSQSIGYDPCELFVERAIGQQEPEDDFSDDGDEALDQLESHLDEYADDGGVTFDAVGPLDATADTIVGRQKGVDVIKELKAICLEYEATSPIENLAIELNSFKFSQNASYSDCVTAAVLAIISKLNIKPGMSDLKLVTEFKSCVEHWSPLLQKMSIGLEEEKSIVLALEQSALSDDEVGSVLSTGASFRLLLQTMHDQEIVSEEAIQLWASERRDTDPESPAGKLFLLPTVQQFIEWLDEDEESEEDDSEESSEEE